MDMNKIKSFENDQIEQSQGSLLTRLSLENKSKSPEKSDD